MPYVVKYHDGWGCYAPRGLQTTWLLDLRAAHRFTSRNAAECFRRRFCLRWNVQDRTHYIIEKVES